MHWLHALAAALLAVVATAPRAAEPPPIPDKPEAETFSDVPEPWRGYLLAARKAERLTDPLQRCLAFPDIPGNEWPKGHAEDHCRHHHGVRRPTLDELERMVSNGELAALDNMFASGLRRHFDQDAFSDDIHDTFNYLLTRPQHGDRVDRLTAEWLRQAPASAYAQLARAAYFNGAAWKARGAKYADKTPRENMRRMRELVDQAIPHFERALEIEPKLMPAYTGLIDVAMLDSRSQLEASVVQRAEKLDPACPELANVRMRALAPRWGGSYEEMLAYAAVLSRHVARRPHLAAHMSRPYADRVDRLIAADQLTVHTLQLAEIAVRMGSDEGALRDAGNVAKAVVGGELGDVRRLAYLLQESRFGELDAWGTQAIAIHLLLNDPQWSLHYGLRVIALEPESATAQFNVGAAYENLGRVAEAERAFLASQQRGYPRQGSLHALANLHLFHGFWTSEAQRAEAARRAKPYIEPLIAEFGEDPRTAILRFYYDAAITNRFDLAKARVLLERIDRTDSWQAAHARQIEAMLGQADEAEDTTEAGR